MNTRMLCPLCLHEEPARSFRRVSVTERVKGRGQSTVKAGVRALRSDSRVQQDLDNLNCGSVRFEPFLLAQSWNLSRPL